MPDLNDKRAEKRLNYSWPMWFCKEYDSEFIQGQMAEISSTHMTFTCYSDSCPDAKDILLVKISVPKYMPDDEFEIKNFNHYCKVSRVDHINPFLRQIVVEFTIPLPFKPGEQKVTNQSALERQFCDF